MPLRSLHGAGNATAAAPAAASTWHKTELDHARRAAPAPTTLTMFQYDAERTDVERHRATALIWQRAVAYSRRLVVSHGFQEPRTKAATACVRAAARARGSVRHSAATLSRRDANCIQRGGISLPGRPSAAREAGSARYLTPRSDNGDRRRATGDADIPSLTTIGTSGCWGKKAQDIP